MAERRPDPRVEQSKGLILDAAIALLIDGGLEAVSIDAVASKAGVARTTVYRHWDDRNDLVRAALAKLRPQLPDIDTTASGREQLRQATAAVADVLSQPFWRRALPALLGAAPRREDFAASTDRIHDDQGRIVSAALAAAKADGTIRTDTELPDAMLFLLGPLTMAILFDPGQVDDTLIDRIVDSFVAAHQPAGRPATRRKSR